MYVTLPFTYCACVTCINTAADWSEGGQHAANNIKPQSDPSPYITDLTQVINMKRSSCL